MFFVLSRAWQDSPDNLNDCQSASGENDFICFKHHKNLRAYPQNGQTADRYLEFLQSVRFYVGLRPL